MKYLKLKLTILFVALLSSGLFAQGFYISANTGYAFNMNPQQGWFSDSHRETIHNYFTGDYSSTTTYKEIKFGLGKGLNFGGSVGYMFNDYLGLDLGFSYLLGAETKVKDSYHSQDIYQDHTEDYYSVSNNKLYSRMFTITPSILITPNFQKINPYLKMGVVLGVGSIYWEAVSERSSTGQVTPTSSTSEYASKFNGGVAIGVNASVGVEYNISDKLSIFGELNLTGMTYNPKKMENTKSTVDGVDQLPNMTTRDKETDFVKKHTETNQPVNEDEPKQQSLLSFPFSSAGVNFGVKFNL